MPDYLVTQQARVARTSRISGWFSGMTVFEKHAGRAAQIC